MRNTAKKVRNGTGGETKKPRLLARPGDPLVTEDGRVIMPEGYEETAEERLAIKPKSYKAAKRRSIRELPADTGTINGVACVMLYTLLGVMDREIAQALKISPEQVRAIKKHAAYTECFNAVSNEFLSANSNLITARLAAYSHEALDGVYRIATKGKKENNVLKANINLLDRAGFTAKEQSNKVAFGRQELRITILEGGEQVDVSHTIGGE